MTRNTKYYVPLILIAFSIGMFSGEFVTRRLLVICPIILAAVFFLSLAIIEVNSGVLRYRRFLKWIPIDESEVRGSGVSWPGVIGYIRLSRYVVPWRRLYFVLDDGPGRNPFARGDSFLLAYLSKRAQPKYQDPLKSGHTVDPFSNLILLILGLAGAAFYSMMRVFLPPLPPPPAVQQPPGANLPALIFFAIERGIMQLLHSFPLAIALCAVFVLAMIYRRRQSDAWLYALLAGTTFAAAFLHFL
jgi:hypothetical protein